MVLRLRILRAGYYWLRGTIVSDDGFVWSTRGVNDASRSRIHEERLRPELQLKGDLFVDVGAHVGTWTVRCSKSFTRVVAFEPQTKTRAVLRENLRLNRCDNVTVQPVALSDIDGLGLMDRRHLALAGESTLNQSTSTKNTVQVRRLDDYDLSPDLLKIDVEGVESKVLAGGEATLKRTQKIIIEVHKLGELSFLEKILADNAMTTRVISVGSLPGQTHLIGERTR